MEVEQIQQKISKLLALSQSPNENEAQAALLKARALMAQYKLRPEIKEESKVIHKSIGITFTFTSEPWVPSLCRTIAINYCCRMTLLHEYGKRTYEVHLAGLPDDFEVCQTAIRYAVQCARFGAEKVKQQYNCNTAKMRREAAKSYGVGFEEGVNEALNQQTKNNQSEWGLIMKIPNIVNQFVNDQIKDSKSFNFNLSSSTGQFRAAGREDGKRYGSQKRIGKEG